MRLSSSRYIATYSHFARAVETTQTPYALLDLTAKGRQEDWEKPEGRADETRPPNRHSNADTSASVNSRTGRRRVAGTSIKGGRLDPLEAIASEIVADGGRADTAQVDATDQGGVDAHFASVVDQAGGVDVSFNLIGVADVQSQELTEMTHADYLRPIELGARTQFITATTAARHMTARGQGVIMAITAAPARLAMPSSADSAPPAARSRVCTGLTGTDYLETLRQDTLLKRFPTLAEVGETAALLASDRASAMTGTAEAVVVRA